MLVIFVMIILLNTFLIVQLYIVASNMLHIFSLANKNSLNFLNAVTFVKFPLCCDICEISAMLGTATSGGAGTGHSNTGRC